MSRVAAEGTLINTLEGSGFDYGLDFCPSLGCIGGNEAEVVEQIQRSGQTDLLQMELATP